MLSERYLNLFDLIQLFFTSGEIFSAPDAVAGKGQCVRCPHRSLTWLGDVLDIVKPGEYLVSDKDVRYLFKVGTRKREDQNGEPYGPRCYR